MANRRASLIRFAKIPGVGWRRGPLIKAKNGRFRPDYMVYKGQDVHCPQGKYEIRAYEGRKCVYKPIGGEIDVAISAFNAFQKKLQYEALQRELGIRPGKLPQEERKTSPNCGKHSSGNTLTDQQIPSGNISF